MQIIKYYGNIFTPLISLLLLTYLITNIASKTKIITGKYCINSFPTFYFQNNIKIILSSFLFQNKN